MIPVACFLALRCQVTYRRHKRFFVKNFRSYNARTKCFTFTAGQIDSFLQYFFVLSTDPDVGEGRLENSRIRIMLAISGPLEKANVEDKLLSRPAIGLLALHLTELLLSWVVVLIFDADSSSFGDANVT